MDTELDAITRQVPAMGLLFGMLKACCWARSLLGRVRPTFNGLGREGEWGVVLPEPVGRRQFFANPAGASIDLRHESSRMVILAESKLYIAKLKANGDPVWKQ